ncbi:MAG: HNH endonuclease, partial [Gammaproteobacteria bacterium]|nr:HNH endonuclease [Gammaproteobacteria bacterium]
YQGTAAQKKRRAKRNAARAKLKKSGRVKLGDGMDVDHKNKNPKNNSNGNLRVQSKGTNRSFPRNKKGGHK